MLVSMVVAYFFLVLMIIGTGFMYNEPAVSYSSTLNPRFFYNIFTS